MDKAEQKELDEVLQTVMPDEYYEDMRKVLLPQIIKWFEKKTNNQLLLTKLEEERFKANKPKQIIFHFGGGIGVTKEIINNKNKLIDITDYDKW